MKNQNSYQFLDSIAINVKGKGEGRWEVVYIKLKAYPLRSGTWQVSSLSRLLPNIELEILARATGKEK